MSTSGFTGGGGALALLAPLLCGFALILVTPRYLHWRKPDTVDSARWFSLSLFLDGLLLTSHAWPLGIVIGAGIGVRYWWQYGRPIQPVAQGIKQRRARRDTR